MASSFYFGYALITLSAVLLAQHWRQWRALPNADPAGRPFTRLQLQRRSVASALIGVVGAAMTLADKVPRTPRAVSGYLFGMLIAGGVIFCIAVVDWRATQRRRHDEVLDLAARELAKSGQKDRSRLA